MDPLGDLPLSEAEIYVTQLNFYRQGALKFTKHF